MGRGLIIALVASLALNIFGIGLSVRPGAARTGGNSGRPFQARRAGGQAVVSHDALCGRPAA